MVVVVGNVDDVVVADGRLGNSPKLADRSRRLEWKEDCPGPGPFE